MIKRKKWNRKSGFLLRDIALAILFGTGIIAIFVLMMGSLSVNYNRPDLVSSSFSQHYNHFSNLSSGLENSRQAVTNSSSGTSLLGTFQVTFNSFFTVVSLVWDSVDMFSQMSANAVVDFAPFLNPGIMTILFDILIAGLVVSVIFIIISSVTRGRV